MNFAASLQENTRVTNVQVSFHRSVPHKQFPTKFTWSRSGKTKVANGIAEAWASKATMPGTGFSIDSWLICLRLRGVVWFWWKVKNCCFKMFQFYQSCNMQRVDREQVRCPLAELVSFAFCLSTAAEEIYRMLESQNVKLNLVSQNLVSTDFFWSTSDIEWNAPISPWRHYQHSCLVLNFSSKLGFHRFSRFVTDEHHFQMHSRRQNTICVNCARLISPIVARTLLDFGGRPSVLATIGWFPKKIGCLRSAMFGTGYLFFFAAVS